MTGTLAPSTGRPAEVQVDYRVWDGDSWETESATWTFAADGANPLRMKTETVAGTGLYIDFCIMNATPDLIENACQWPVSARLRCITCAEINNKVITRVFEGSGSGLVAGRDLGFQVGVTGDLDQDYAVAYHYDSAGRLSRIAGPGLPAWGVEYERVKDGQGVVVSDAVGRVWYKSDSSTTLAETQRVYETARDLIDSIENKAGSSLPTVSKYDYTSDVLGRRTSVVRRGSAFPPRGSNEGFVDVHGYNDRSELTGTERRDWDESTGNGSLVVPHGEFEYAYDPIGNRQTHTDAAGETVYKTTNRLNQY